MKTTMKVLAGLFLVLSSAFAYRQDAEDYESKKEKIEAAKIALITQELSLTTEEAQKFWPIYNKFTEDKRALWGRHDKNKSKSIDEMSDSEVEKMLNEKMEKKAKILDLEKKYEADLKTVLPVKKIAKLYAADRKFKRQMIEKFKEHRRDKSSDDTKTPKK